MKEARCCSPSTSGRSKPRCSRRRRSSQRDTAQAANARAQRGALPGPADARHRDARTGRPVAASADGARRHGRADRAAVDNAKVQLQYATIAAPISGRTGALMVHEGNLVRANDTTPLVVINQVVADLRVVRRPRSDSCRTSSATWRRARVARRGAAAQRDGDAGDRARSPSSTTPSIRPPARSRSRATFPNTDRRLWPGQFVNVT